MGETRGEAGVALDAFDWQRVYPRGLSRAFAPPDQPLWTFLAESAKRHGDRDALTAAGRSVSYAALWDAALAWSARLRAAGAAPGDRAALVLPNCPDFVAAFHGALAAGLVVTAASPHLTAPELSRHLEDAFAGVIVTTASRKNLAEAASSLAGRSVPVLLARDGAEAPETPSPAETSNPRIPPHRADPRDIAVLQYTSGTTGGLKAAAMTHRNLVANALQNNAWFGWTADDVVLGALPLCHTWGMCCVMNAALAAGARVALLSEFDAGAALETIRRERVTVAYGSATMFHRLLDAAGTDAPAQLATLRYVKAGAMLVGGDLHARWTAAVPGVPKVSGYGLTEAGPEVTNNPPHARRPGTVGVPLPGTELRLCAPDDPSREVDRGEEGEVQVRGPQVMKGYWTGPASPPAGPLNDLRGTRNCPAWESGWLRTGDLGAFDEEGYLVIRDRLKDLIKFRGWSVVPGEVEAALREHPAVSDACVVGVPDARDGEVPVAYVVLRAGCAAPTAAAWDEHLAPRLARAKHPRRVIAVAEIPRNHVGKPLRRVLRDSAREESAP